MHVKQNGTGVSTGENETPADMAQANGTRMPRIKLKAKSSQGAPPTLPPENLEEILAELPNVTDDLIPLSLVVDRVVQDAYAKLNEMADTMPGREDRDRKRSIAEYARDTRKQIIKTYVLAKWARVADDVHRSMNITQHLVNHNGQFDHAVQALTHVKDTLGQARRRNYDLLTAVDVLTTGTYRRLPTIIDKMFETEKPLTNSQVSRGLTEVDTIIRYRLSMHEVVPLEMQGYYVADGRVYFTAPGLFKASFGLTGSAASDVWYIIHLEFLTGVGPNRREEHEFPRVPPPHIWSQIEPGVNTQLALHRPAPSNPSELTNANEAGPSVVKVTIPTVPESEEVVDAPLIRAFNLLQMLSMTYQLEILYHQALQLRPLGWADYLKVEISRDRRIVIISYWVRPAPPPPPQRQANTPQPPQRPLYGGTLTLSVITEATPDAESHADKIALELEEKCKLGRNAELSDKAAKVRLVGRWEVAPGALGVSLSKEVEAGEIVQIDSENLDLEAILKSVIQKHTRAVLHMLRSQILDGESRHFFSSPQELELVDEDNTISLRINLHNDHVLLLSIDQRMGKISLRDSGDLLAWSRGLRFFKYSEQLNTNPGAMVAALRTLKASNIIEAVEHQATQLGLYHQLRLLQGPELEKLGANAHGHIYIRLREFPSHYLVLILKSSGFKYGLINVRKVEDFASRTSWLVDDLGWLDLPRIGIGVGTLPEDTDVPISEQRKRSSDVNSGKPEEGNKRPRLDSAISIDGVPRTSSFEIEIDVLRKLYAFCCARVCHTKVEQQLKSRGIPYEQVFPSLASSTSVLPIPAIWIRSRDIWQGNESPGDAAMDNVRVVVTDWWKEEQCRVVTTVKLKYSQPVSGPVATATAKTSRNVTYNPVTSLVSFRSTNPETCVTEFLEQWARVERVLEIAREIGSMKYEKGWEDVQLLSFDLEQIKFAYHTDYTVSIQWLPPTPQMLLNDLDSRGSYEMTFGLRDHGSPVKGQASRRNPHEESAPLMSARLHVAQSSGSSFGRSVCDLVSMLRATLPLALVLDEIRLQGINMGVEVCCKGASHFRILYRRRHALDFRVNVTGQVMMLDSSRSLFPRARRQTPPVQPSVFTPIPKFNDLIKQVIHTIATEQAALQQGGSPPKSGPATPEPSTSWPPVVNLGDSVVASEGLVSLLARRLNDAIVSALPPP